MLNSLSKVCQVCLNCDLLPMQSLKPKLAKLLAATELIGAKLSKAAESETNEAAHGRRQDDDEIPVGHAYKRLLLYVLHGNNCSQGQSARCMLTSCSVEITGCAFSSHALMCKCLRSLGASPTPTHSHICSLSQRQTACLLLSFDCTDSAFVHKHYSFPTLCLRCLHVALVIFISA